MTTRAPFWMKSAVALAAVVGIVASSAALATTLVGSAKPATVGRALGNFTPASADPRLAMAFARSTTLSSGFRFTPASAAKTNRKVTVAVRARSSQSLPSVDRPVSAGTLATIAPLAYNLGVSVGWRRFAVSGDMGEASLGLAGGRRQAADLGLSYTAKRWSTRLQVAAERPVGTAPRIVDTSESVALDVGGSYRLTRNIDVTAGVRYKSQRERLEPLKDNRRDSQAVYLGTAFRF